MIATVTHLKSILNSSSSGSSSSSSSNNNNYNHDNVMKKQHEVECYDSTTGQTKSFPLDYLISLLFKYLLHCAEMYIHHKPIKRINEIDGEITAVYARNNCGDIVVDDNGDGNGNNRSRDVYCDSSSSRDASIDKIIHRVVIG
jgi:hypothetical protein